MQFAAGEDGIWAADQGRITWYPQEGTPIPVGQVEGISRMAGYGRTVYLLTQEGTAQKIIGMDLTGRIVYEADLPGELFVQQLEVWEDCMYLLALPEQPQAGQFPSAYHLYTARLEVPLDLRPYETDAFAPQKVDAISFREGMLFVASYPQMLAIREGSGKVEASLSMMETPITAMVGGRMPDGAWGIYCLEGSIIQRISLKEGSVIEAASGLPGPCTMLRRAGDVLYCRSAGAGSVVQVPLLDGLENILVIWNLDLGNGDREEIALRTFREKYPDVQVILRSQMDYRVMATHMLAGEIDLLASPSGAWYPVEQYYRAGAIEDLAQYPEIREALDSYLDIFGSERVGEALVALPMYSYPTLWVYNEALGEKLGIEAPASGWTWSDLFAMADRIEAFNQQHGTAYTLVADYPNTPQLMEQINVNALDVMAGEAHFLRDEYIKALEGWRDIASRGLVTDRRSNPSPKAEFPEALFQVKPSVLYQSLEDTHYVMPPVFDESTRLPVKSNHLMLNANARHKEAAVNFLTCYFSVETTLQADMGHAGPWLPEDPRTFNALRYAAYDPPSAENTALWLETLGRGTQEMGLSQLYQDQLLDLFPKFLAGEMDARQYLQRCEDRANMMLGE